MKHKEQFIKEAKQTRAEFAAAVMIYSVTFHKHLRTKADSLLIMYDQMAELIECSEHQLDEL